MDAYSSATKTIYVFIICYLKKDASSPTEIFVLTCLFLIEKFNVSRVFD